MLCAHTGMLLARNGFIWISAAYKTAGTMMVLVDQMRLATAGKSWRMQSLTGMCRVGVQQGCGSALDSRGQPGKAQTHLILPVNFERPQ